MGVNPHPQAEVVDLSQRDSLTRLVYGRLREELMSGIWKPGSRLTIRGQAQRFRISPTPAREAMLQLASENSLVLDARSFSVPQLTVEQFLEIRKIRGSLEGLLVKEAITGPNPQLATALAEIHRQLMDAKSQGMYDEVMARNRLFHFSIYELAGMPQAFEMVKSLWVQIGPYHNAYTNKDPIEPAQHEHLKMISGIRVGDAGAVVSALLHDINYPIVHPSDEIFAKID